MFERSASKANKKDKDFFEGEQKRDKNESMFI